MAHEMEDFLREEIGIENERLKRMAVKLEELMQIDCPLGVCVFDPKIQELEHRLDEIQHRKEVIEGALNTVQHQAR